MRIYFMLLQAEGYLDSPSRKNCINLLEVKSILLK